MNGDPCKAFDGAVYYDHLLIRFLASGGTDVYFACVDAFASGGANCYRRVLLEAALDAGAAREDVVLGLNVGRTGHAWLGKAAAPAHEVEFTFPAEEP